MSKEKPLCDWSKKDLREHWKELCHLVASPKYACMKCGRAAAKKGVLCKPKTIEPSTGSAD